MTHKACKFIWLLPLVIVLIWPLITSATDFLCPPGTSISKCQELKLQEVYNNSYGTTAEAVTALTVSEKIGIIISYMLAFLGVIFLVLVIYSGFQWLTAGGNEDKVKQARSRITNAVFGLIIILAAFAITNFIGGKIQNPVAPPAAEQTPE